MRESSGPFESFDLIFSVSPDGPLVAFHNCDRDRPIPKGTVVVLNKARGFRPFCGNSVGGDWGDTMGSRNAFALARVYSFTFVRTFFLPFFLNLKLYIERRNHSCL